MKLNLSVHQIHGNLDNNCINYCRPSSGGYLTPWDRFYLFTLNENLKAQVCPHIPHEQTDTKTLTFKIMPSYRPSLSIFQRNTI